MYLRWLSQMVFNLFGFISAPVIFPIAYLLKDVRIVREKLLWIYYDDEDDFGFDVYWWMVGRKRNFFTAYKWCAIRNPMWNGHTLSMLKGFSIGAYIFFRPKGILQRDGKVLSDNNTAVLKYENEFGKYMDNKGEYLSTKFSTIGSQYIEFIHVKSGKIYWRYSFANKVYRNIWIEFQAGYTTRATFRLKIKNITKIR